MALMDRNSRKRQRLESLECCSNPSICVESEENPGKRICEDLDCGNVDIFSELLSHDVHCPQESINEDLVWDMMKKLEEEIVSSSSHEEASVNKCESTHQVCDILGDNGEAGAESAFREELKKVECEFNAFHGDLNDLSWGSEMENLEYYYEDYGFFECLEMERDVENQFLLEKWWSTDNDSDGCDMTRDLISVQDSSLFSN